MIIGIPTPLPPSIKAFPSPLQASLQVPKFPRSLCCKSLHNSLKAKSKQGDCRQDPKRGFSHPWQAFRDVFCWRLAEGEFNVRTMVVIFLWLIINEWLLVMVPLLLLFMMMSYVLSDWNIVESTGFYACVCLFLACAGVPSRRSWGS